MPALRHLRTIGILLLLVIAVGTAGYHYIEGWNWFDAVSYTHLRAHET